MAKGNATNKKASAAVVLTEQDFKKGDVITDIPNPKPMTGEAQDALNDILGDDDWGQFEQPNAGSNVDQGVTTVTNIQSKEPLPQERPYIEPEKPKQAPKAKEFIEEYKSDPSFTSQEGLEESMPAPASRTIDEILRSRNRVVVVKSIPRNGFRMGFESQPEKFLAAPGTALRWAPDKKGNRYKTGLEKLEAKEIRKLEEELGRNLDNNFYAELRYPLDRNKAAGQKLNLDDAYDYVLYLAMSQSSLIATTLSQYHNNEGDADKTNAEFYFEDLEAEALAEADKINELDQAREILKTQSPAYLRNLAITLGVAVAGVSDLVVSTQLRKFLEDNIKTRQKNAKMIISSFRKGADYVRVTALVKKALGAGVISQNPTKDYVYGANILGATEDFVVMSLLEPKNSGLRLAIQERIALQESSRK